MRLVSLALLGCFSCRDATQVTLDISTDVPCERISQTSITVGPEGTTERGDPAVVTASCRSDGTIAAVGTYAVIPGKESGLVVSAKVVLAITEGVNVVTDCTAEKSYRGCIVARRRLGFVKYRNLQVPIEMLLACKDVQCDQKSTCDRAGRCVGAEVNVEQCPNNTCTQLVLRRNEGLACFGDKNAPLLCGGDAAWCSENGGGDWGCTSEPSDTGRSFSCREAPDCGANLFCVRGADNVLGRCVVTVAPDDLVLCKPETAGPSCPLPRTCSVDAGAGLLGCSAPDAGPQIQERTGARSDPGDQVGQSVALSDDGRTMAVGAWGEQANVSGINGDETNNDNVSTGAAYVFVQAYDGWVQQAYFKPSNPKFRQDFGVSVALSADGNTLAVGASGEQSNATGIDGDQSDVSAFAAGAVYVFKRTGTTWVQQSYIKASNTWGESHFGYALSFSGDGQTLVVGSHDEDSASVGINSNQFDHSAISAGAAYVFVQSGSTWVQQAYLKPSNTETLDSFGYSLSLSTDGNTLAISSMGDDEGTWNTGAIFVFSRTGTSWSETAKLVASNPLRDYFFGASLALSGDGNVLVAGCGNEGSNATGVNGSQVATGHRAGAAYVFQRSGGVWAQTTYLKASNTDNSDWFGWAVAISRDGDTIASGAVQEGSNGDPSDNSLLRAGAGYVFRRSGTSWAQEAYVKAPMPAAGDKFGHSLALNGDGTQFAVGSPGRSSGAGAVFWYRIP